MNLGEMRRAMWAGVAFVVLFVVGVLVSFGNTPNIKKHDSDAVSAAKYVTQLSDSGHRAGLVVGAYLLILAALAFVWFTRGLAARLPSVTAGRFVSALGVLGAGAIAVATMTSADVAGAVSFGHEKVPANGDSIRVVMDLTFPFLFVVFALVSAAILATVAVAGRGSDLPGWLVNTAWIGVLGAIFAVIFFPMVLVLLWYLIAAVTGATRPAVGAPAVATT